MDRKKTKCDSCEEHFSYNKTEGYAVVFKSCKHSLCSRCYTDLTKTVDGVECSRSCRKKSIYSDLLKINCASGKICCTVCNDSLEGLCKELDCHHPVCNDCSGKPLSCLLCQQASEQMCKRQVFIKDQSITRERFATDIDEDIVCQACKQQKGEVKLCLCDHVVCRSCLTKAEKHELTVECPLSSLCRMRYPLDVLKSSKTKERDTSPPFGMPSVGLTCYASCILQVLSSTPSFVTLLDQNAPKKESFSDLLLAILKNRSEDEDKKQDIIHLLVFLESIDGTFDRFSQNDCASFLHVLLDALGRDEQTQGDFDGFFVDMIDEIECSTCMCKEHADFQRVLGIQLTTNLSKTLDKDNLSEEIFENGPLKCFKCQSNEKLAKKTKMLSCPPVLVFQIQRIVETGKGFFKRTDPVEFSFDLKVVGSEDEKRIETSKSVGEIKTPIAALCGVPRHCVEIVDMEEGIIYDDCRDVTTLSRPLQVMVGTDERRVPFYLLTTDADMIDQDPDDEEPRLKMSCGHAITPYNLFGHMRDSLINKVKSSVTCLTTGCYQEWSMNEIIKKADMTPDESLFFEYKISLNAIFSHNNDTSECPNCGQFCQRQQNTQAVRCSICSTKRNEKQADFCWDCKAPWIPNHTCKNRDLEAIQKILNEAPLKTLDYSKIERVPSKRLCPNCRTLIEHERMCKQMKCPSCQTEFCFACLTLCVGGRLQCTGYSMECSVASVQNAFS